MIALRTFWNSITDIFEELFVSIAANVLFCLIALPLPYVAFVLWQEALYPGAVILALLAPIPLAVASGGLTHLARHIADGKAVKWSTISDGIRQNIRRRITIWYLWSAVFYACFFNIWFYGSAEGMPFYLAALFFDLTILWLGYLAFLLPMSARYPDQSLPTLLRNSAGVMFSIAGSMILMAIIASLLFIMSSLLLILMIFFFWIFVTLWGTRLTDASIKIILDRQEQEQASADDYTDDDGPRQPKGQVRPK